MSDNDTLATLAKALGHSFEKPALLERALTHASLSGADLDRLSSYERMEFLGDRVLGLIVAEMLLRRFPEEPEGDIAKRHTALVRQESLVRVAEVFDLGKLIFMSSGEEITGGRENPSILADVCEAIIAALYVDGGLEVAREFIEIHWRDMLEETPVPPKDAKTTLQEWAQGIGLPLPDYTETGREGPDHEPEFTVAVSLEGYPSVEAKGRSKRAAEQAAADKFLNQLDIANTDG
ncbi:MAG: ribonuclease III [Rhodospirillaceae bacterium]